jgi:hypothetical protein
LVIKHRALCILWKSSNHWTLFLALKEVFRTSLYNVVKISSVQTNRVLKAVKQKNQVTYKGKPMRMSADFSEEFQKAKRAWTVPHTPKETNW